MAQNYVNSTIHITSAASSPVTLLARCLVLPSVPPAHYSAGHILQFLLRFSANLSPVLGSGSQVWALWETSYCTT